MTSGNVQPAFSLSAALELLARGASLSRPQARAAMDALLSGSASPAQVGAFLMGLRAKGETAEEVVGLAEGMRAASVRVDPGRDGVMDLCGTGGDRRGTFNISTAASLVVAGSGVPVAKHGNRSASSRCGSADVLEALGVPIAPGRDVVEEAIRRLGYGFLFAPSYHPAMKHVAGVRRELGFGTVFNILGPMTNPAGVRRQLLGVFADSLRPLVASVLRSLGCERAWVVHGSGGLDEASLAGPTAVTEIAGGAERSFEIAPEEAGLPRLPVASLEGGDAARNARILEDVLAGAAGPYRDAVLFNSAAALVVAGASRDLREGAERAREAIDSGAARQVLDGLRALR